MSLREEIESHPVATTWTALAVVALACGVLVWRLAGASSENEADMVPAAYFYDQNTGDIFEAPGNLSGPLETDSGPYDGRPAGVRAHVFACGQCRDKSNHYVGWLEMPPSALGKVDATDEFTLIRRPDDKEWVPSNSSAGERIIDEASRRCDDGKANYCRPAHTK